MVPLHTGKASLERAVHFTPAFAAGHSSKWPVVKGYACIVAAEVRLRLLAVPLQKGKASLQHAVLLPPATAPNGLLSRASHSS